MIIEEHNQTILAKERQIGKDFKIVTDELLSSGIRQCHKWIANLPQEHRVGSRYETLIKLLHEEIRYRNVQRFIEEHECGPEESWDETSRTLFAIQHPEVSR